ncbi:MAG: cytochrome c, class I [Pseudomonadota bacterium]
MKTCILVLALLTLPAAVQAEQGPERAHYNYQLFCQGCHGPTGDGRKGVPRIHSEMGVFLNSQAGREYLVRVPGAANAPINDAQLADLMNWTLYRFAGDSLPEQWLEYTAQEVTEYRKQPLLEVLKHREQLLSELQ